MGWTPTLVALAIAVGVAVFCGWRGARPADPHRGPRLIPYRFLMLLAAAVVVLMLVHVRSLSGLDAGRR